MTRNVYQFARLLRRKWIPRLAAALVRRRRPRSLVRGFACRRCVHIEWVLPRRAWFASSFSNSFGSTECDELMHDPFLRPTASTPIGAAGIFCDGIHRRSLQPGPHSNVGPLVSKPLRPPPTVPSVLISLCFDFAVAPANCSIAAYLGSFAVRTSFISRVRVRSH